MEWLLFCALWVTGSAREYPWIGLGLAGNLNADNAVVNKAVGTWLQVGGRAVDAALMYYNDEGLLKGLEDFYGMSQTTGDVFITTKIPPEQMGFEQTLEAIKEGQRQIIPSQRHGSGLR